MKINNNEEIKELTEQLLQTKTLCKSGRQAALAWLQAVDTPNQAAADCAYRQELQEDILSVDELIAFAQSDRAEKYLGKEKADQLAKHGIQLKEKHAAHCDCAACQLAEKIVSLLPDQNH
jgi:hypothetical protein